MDGNKTSKEQIDERILRMLNLEDTFDLDYDTYYTLVKEKLVEVSRGKNIPTDEVILLREELKRAKSKKGTGGRFKPEKKKIKKESISNLKNLGESKKSPLLLPGSSAPIKKKKENNQKPIQKNDDNKYQPILKSLDNISNILSQQLNFDKKESENERKSSEKSKRKSKENALENAFKKGIGAISAAAKVAISPFQDLIQRLINFISWVFFGKLFMDLMNWFNDPKNEEKVNTIKKIIKTFLPAIVAAILLFTNPFGKFIRMILGMVVRWTFRIAKFAIPRLLKFIAKNKVAAAGIALFGAGAAIPMLFPQTVDEQERKTESAPGSNEEKINQLKKQKEGLNWFQKNVQGMGPEIDEQIERLNTGKTQSYSSGGSVGVDHGYNGIDSNTGEKITGAGRDTQLIAARPGEVVLTPEDQKNIYKDIGFDVKKYVSGRTPKYINTSNIKFSNGGYSHGGIIQKFDVGGVVGGGGNNSQLDPNVLIDLQNTINQSTSNYRNQPSQSKETSLGIPLIRNNPLQSLKSISEFGLGSLGWVLGAPADILHEASQMIPRKQGGGSITRKTKDGKRVTPRKKRSLSSALPRQGWKPPTWDWENRQQEKLYGKRKFNWNRYKNNSVPELLYMDSVDFGQIPLSEATNYGRYITGNNAKNGKKRNPNYLYGTRDRMPGSSSAYSLYQKYGTEKFIDHPARKIYKNLNYLQGGGIFPVTTRTGIDIRGGISGIDTQYLPEYNTAVQPGEEIFKYVITKDAAEKGAGSLILNFAERMTANLDSNSNAAKMGLRTKDYSSRIQPYSIDGGNEVNVSTIPMGGIGGGVGNPVMKNGGSTDYFHSPISQAGISERQRILDLLGITAFE